MSYDLRRKGVPTTPPSCVPTPPPSCVPTPPLVAFHGAQLPFFLEGGGAFRDGWKTQSLISFLKDLP